MITQVTTKKMVVISDLHLGNPFSHSKRKVVRFIRWATEQGYDICINGDGFEIAQASFKKLSQDVPEVFNALKSSARKGTQTYYVVGNHDIALENFLDDWGALKMAPFLNVTCGDLRVRVEHGHLYDPFFVKYPRLYEVSTWVGGVFLKTYPEFYRLWIGFERFMSKLRAKKGKSITGEASSFAQSAYELSQRGFDHVVFGHTHHVGKVHLGVGKYYFNPGSWMLGSSYVEIESSKISLKSWTEH